MMSPQRFDFEQWYRKVYWNFPETMVMYDSFTNTYNHADVNLAWHSWQEGQMAIRKFMGIGDAEV
jgi:hypothetical protein